MEEPCQPNGTKSWRDAEGRLHREDGPALIIWRTQINGILTSEEWFQHGKRHRPDGPAFQHMLNGKAHYSSWWIDGKLHRDGGPAKSGVKGDEWFWHGKIHRADGPAWEIPGVLSAWYLNGQLHNENGAARTVTDKSGKIHREEWWIKGGRHRDDGPALITPHEIAWYQHGKLHRDDGPAQIIKNGQLIRQKNLNRWFHNGRLHRTDGAAVEYPGGSKEYWLSGRLHRDDGPAVELAQGFAISHPAAERFRKKARELDLDNPNHGQIVHQKNEYWIAGRQLSEVDFLARHEKKKRNNLRFKHSK